MRRARPPAAAGRDPPRRIAPLELSERCPPRAPVGETASARRIEERGHEPLDRREPPLLLGPLARNAAQESSRVGVPAPREDLHHVGVFHHPPGVHHRHLVADLGDHPHVVRDEDDGRPGSFLEFLDEMEDLRLDRHVERRRGLVRDQERRLAEQGHGDHDPLLHPAREFVGVGRDARLGLGDPHHVEHRDGPGAGLVPLDPEPELQDLAQLLLDAEDGVERGHRVLKDHRDLVAADRPQLSDRHLQDIVAAEQDLAAQDPAGRARDEPQDRRSADALAAPRLADDAERAPGVDPERDPVHRVEKPVLGLEGHLEVPHLEERPAGGAGARDALPGVTPLRARASHAHPVGGGGASRHAAAVRPRSRVAHRPMRSRIP